MFLPAPNAKGCLTVSISAVDTLVQVDSSLGAYLGTVLGIGGSDHTYLRIGVAPTCEYVRAVSVDASLLLTVERGIDGTVPGLFISGVDVEYVLTAAAVGDMIADTPPANLTIEGEYPINVTQLDEVLTVSLAPVSVTSPDSTIDVTGEFPDIGLSVIRGINGCGC